MNSFASSPSIRRSRSSYSGRADIFPVLMIIGAVASFLLSHGVLELVGWQFASDDVGMIWKLHPSTYVFAMIALMVILRNDQRLKVLPRSFFFYSGAAALSLAAAVLFQVSGRSSGGEQSIAIVTFIMPVTALIGLLCLRDRHKRALATSIRIIFVLNSCIALLEFVFQIRIIQNLYMEINYEQWRSGGLLGHPLTNAYLTGVLIVYMATASNRERPFLAYLPEFALHSLAIFTFGGRAALGAIPFVLLISAFLRPSSKAAPTTSLARRLAPIVIGGFLVAVSLLPIPFTQAIISRLSDDQGSADTRMAAVQMLGDVDLENVLFGADATQRLRLMHLYDSPLGIEIAWIALTLTFGLVVTAALAITLIWLFHSITKRIDPSGRSILLYFLIVTAGSLSIGVKSLLITQTVLMIYAFSSGVPAKGRRPIGMSPFFGFREQTSQASRSRRLSHPKVSSRRRR